MKKLSHYTVCTPTDVEACRPTTCTQSQTCQVCNLMVRRRFEIRFKLASFVAIFFLFLRLTKIVSVELRSRNFLIVRTPDDGRIWSAVRMVTDRETRSTAIQTCNSAILSAINSTSSGLTLNTGFHRDNSETMNMNLRQTLLANLLANHETRLRQVVRLTLLHLKVKK